MLTQLSGIYSYVLYAKSITNQTRGVSQLTEHCRRIFGTFFYLKSEEKHGTCLWKRAFSMVEKAPFGVCYDCYTSVVFRKQKVTLCPCHEPLVVRVAQNSGLPNNFGRVEYNTYLFKDVLNT